MVKPPRNPLLGYNRNIKYGGKIFHVQTEDSGPANPHVFTHLFFEGSILASKRSQYDPVFTEEQVRDMMQSQHKAILKELKQAHYNERIARFFETRGESFPTDDFFTDTPTPGLMIDTPEPQVDSQTTTPAVISPPQTTPPEKSLDLDSPAPAPRDRIHTPIPPAVHHKTPLVSGPGAYTFRRPTRERLPVVSSTTTPRTATPANPLPAAPRNASRTTMSRAPTPAPGSSVIVQRQVVVGGGTKPAQPSKKSPPTPRRRPSNVGPYVVKEGSHPNLVDPHQAVEIALRPGPPQSPASTTAPRMQSPPPTTSPSPAPKEQSLDEAILAYLLQGDGKS